MMNVYRSLLIAVLWVAAAHAQTIFVADNNPNAPLGDGSVNVYASLQAAIDAASDDDIIHVVPSNTNYGLITLNKRLTLLGPGHSLRKDRRVEAHMSLLTVASGASGSRIAGLGFHGNDEEGLRFSASVSNIVIEKCVVRMLSSKSGGYPTLDDGHYVLSNVLVRHCKIYQALAFLHPANSDILISHNVFESGHLGFRAHTTVSNNLFIAPAPAGGSYFNLVYEFSHMPLIDGVFRNNIFYGVGIGAEGDYNSNTFRNNLIYRVASIENTPPDDFPPGNANEQYDNIKGVDPLFVNFPVDGADWLAMEYDLHLGAGSPGLNAGADETNIGLFGGTMPYTTATLPYIEQFSTADVVKQGDNLNVEIRARAK
jgi:hypothetical protein